MSDVAITMSPTVGAIGAAIAKAQLEMRPAVKDSENPHFKNRYASLAACVEALRPLHEQGIAVIQPPAVHGTDGVCVATLLVHASGEWIRGELYMPASKRDAQGFGSSLSYARRYCLAATTGLATDDDDGETSSRPQEAPSNGVRGQQSSSARGDGREQSQPRAEGARKFESDKAVVESLCLRIDSASSRGALGAIVEATRKAYAEKKLSDADYAHIARSVKARGEVLSNGHSSDRNVSRHAGES